MKRAGRSCRKIKKKSPSKVEKQADPVRSCKSPKQKDYIQSPKRRKKLEKVIKSKCVVHTEQDSSKSQQKSSKSKCAVHTKKEI
jgi:hypothetical protein